MKLGYNTNGFAHHRLEDAIVILAELGYRSVALTLDYNVLNPFEPDVEREARRLCALLDRFGMSCVVETGARFLLDPRRKHQPTLLSADLTERRRRFEFLTQAIDLAMILRAEAVSFWSGSAASDEPAKVLSERLADSCRSLADHAARRYMRLAFEPEPGMFIATMERFRELHERVNHPVFGLTLDIGHLHCQGEEPLADHIRAWRDRLWNVHIEDMRRGVHDHLMFGEGEISFGPVFAALNEIGYTGGVHVELSRHSHDAVNVARQARDYLRAHGFPTA